MCLHPVADCNICDAFTKLLHDTRGVDTQDARIRDNEHLARIAIPVDWVEGSRTDLDENLAEARFGYVDLCNSDFALGLEDRHGFLLSGHGCWRGGPWFMQGRGGKRMLYVAESQSLLYTLDNNRSSPIPCCPPRGACESTAAQLRRSWADCTALHDQRAQARWCRRRRSGSCSGAPQGRCAHIFVAHIET